MFSKIGDAAIKKDLTNITAILRQLSNPQNYIKTIHIAGTNGKGSTSHMLAAILQKAGYKTGLYTSPHLKDFRERIKVDGKMVPKAYVQHFVNRNHKFIDHLQPSFFEVTVAMAISYFEDVEVDVAIIETGLGGRLDSTNIITPQLSVITNISLDHTKILGDTLAEIAAEKAGIIKPGIPVVIGEKHPESFQVFKDKARQSKSPLTFADQELGTKDTFKKTNFLFTSVTDKENKLVYSGINLDLQGSYQTKNLVTVIQSVLELRKIGYTIPREAIYRGLKSVKTITGLQGRWETLDKNPLIICDTGHNIAGITEVVYNIENTPHKQLHMVFGMVNDKDITSVLAILPKNASYYFTQANIPRALPATELANQAKAFNLNGSIFNTVIDALNAAKKNAAEGDLIFVGGSTFVVAEVL
ncbi:bifunctional folylpolyglutamate synthase/dihydrofolate synthase [Pedobacter sp. MC2016-14]|uniref:bifunctional folylpolyglutamate synthase/dihydrofolate synthase n=1 Tax=Pedobacter sp. MC2016-14 TaxID=2897327 RepID=UPI001E2C1DA9|nr:folylpolyglutamate synthase/dihydrofolate synthase family protein [Pedobacter sp. MC2016-14]MCD0489047.1 bifunctional folylpolyglutamate synthase/dihydrofolate synthase [Pedobacter sp. MC2016-14]